MGYALLALDMDGTLLDSEKRVSPRTRHALQELSNRGVAIAYATGRNVAELQGYSSDLPFIRYGVLAGGSFVYDFATRRVLASTPLPSESVQGVVRLAREDGALAFLSCMDCTRTTQRDIDLLDSYGMGVYQPWYDIICERLDDPLTWETSHPGLVTKLDLYYPDDDSCARTQRRVKAAGIPVELWESEPGCLEATVVGVNKAHGLRMLAELLGMGMDAVVAAGDGGNDLAMLRAVGMPVAMANASAEVLATAYAVVPDNDHDGIVELVERFF